MPGLTAHDPDDDEPPYFSNATENGVESGLRCREVLDRTSFGMQDDELAEKSTSPNIGMQEAGHQDDDLCRNVQRLLDGQHRMELQLRQLIDGSLGQVAISKMQSSGGYEVATSFIGNEDQTHQEKVHKSKATQSLNHFGSNAVNPRHTEHAVAISGSMLESLQVREELGSVGDLNSQDFMPSPNTPNSDRLMSTMSTSVAMLKKLSSMQRMSQEHIKEHPPWSFLLLPNSNTRLAMDVFSSLVLSWDLLSLPYLLAFDVPQEGFVLILMIISVSFWSLDVVVHFRTGVFNPHDGSVEMRPGRIARNYLRGHFSLDFTVVAIDLASILLRVYLDDRAAVAGGFKLTRVLKVSRIARLLVMMRASNVIHTLNELAQRSQHSHSLKAFFTLTKFFVITMWLVHMMACFWIVMGRGTLGTDTGMTWYDLQTGDDDGTTYGTSNMIYQYTTALHWALTQLTPGSMQVAPVSSGERVYNVICLMAGMIVFSTLISSISGVLVQHNMQENANNTRVEKMCRFLQQSKVSPKLTLELQRHVKEKLLQAQMKPIVVKDVEVLNFVSIHFRTTLQVELCTPVLQQHPCFFFLQHADITSFTRACEMCDLNVLPLGDSLFLPLAEAKGIYFVNRGSLSYSLGADIHADEDLREDVGEDKWLCEAAMWCNWRHVGKAYVDSGVMCEVMHLSAEKFIIQLEDQPQVAQLMAAYAESFVFALRKCQPPLFDFPSDIHVPFETAQVFSSMPKQARLVLGQTAVKFMGEVVSTLGSTLGWMTKISADSFDTLMQEVDEGKSTLVMHPDQGVERFVPLVVLRVERSDGRVLVRLQGGEEANCKLPASKQVNGEPSEDALQKLLVKDFGPIAEDIRRNMERPDMENKSEYSKRFGIHTRYLRSVFKISWDDAADEHLQPFLYDPPEVEERDGQRRGTKRRSSKTSPHRALAFLRHGSFNFRHAGVVSALLTRSQPEASKLFRLPSGKLVAWFTPEDLEYFGSSSGSADLRDWLEDFGIGSTVPSPQESRDAIPPPQESRDAHPPPQESRDARVPDDTSTAVWVPDDASKGGVIAV